MASGKRINIFALCIFFLYTNLDRGVLGQYPYDYAGNITVLNISANTYDPNNSYFWIDDQAVPNESLSILKPVGQDASDNLTINQYSDTGNGKVRQGGESAICSFFQNRDDPRVQADLEARTIFTILFSTQQNCPLTNTTNLVPAGYSTVFNYDSEVSCDSWIYVLEIPDPNNKDSPYLTVTLQIDMEKIYKCGESIPVEVVPPSESGSIGNQVCDRLSSDGSNLTLSLVYATGRDNEYMVTQDVNIARNEYNIDVLHTFDRYFFSSYFNIFFFTKNSIDDESPQLLYTNSICNLILGSSDETKYPPGFFPSVVTRMVFPDRDSCKFENKTTPIIANRTVTEIPAQNPGITFPDIPRWYLLVNIVLQRNISDPLHGYIIQILYAVDQDGLENSKECIPPEKSSEEVPTTPSTVSNQESGVLTTPPTISSEQVSSPETESSAISQEVLTTPSTVSNQESGVLTTPSTISSEQVSSPETESSAISQEVPTTPPTISSEPTSSPETESSAISQEVPTTPPTISSEPTSSPETESSAISQEVPTTPSTVSNQVSGVLTTPPTISSEQVSSPETEGSAISQEVLTTPSTVSNQESGVLTTPSTISSEQVSSPETESSAISQEVPTTPPTISSEPTSSPEAASSAISQEVLTTPSTVSNQESGVPKTSPTISSEQVSSSETESSAISQEVPTTPTTVSNQESGDTIPGQVVSSEQVSSEIESSNESKSYESKNSTSLLGEVEQKVEGGLSDVTHAVEDVGYYSIHVPLDIISWILEAIYRIIYATIHGVTSGVHRVGEGVEYTVDGTGDAIEKVIDTVEDSIKDAYNTTKNSIVNTIDTAEDGYDDVKSVIEGFIDDVRNLLEGTLRWTSFIIRHPITGTEDGIKDIFSAFTNKIEGGFSEVERLASDGVNDVESVVSNAVSGAEHGVSSAISTVTNGVTDVVKDGITGTENAAKDVYNGAKDAVEGTINFVEHPIDGTEDIISGIKNSITNLGDKIVDTITGSSAGNSSESGAGNQVASEASDGKGSESEVGTTNNADTSKSKESSTLASDEDKSESLVGKTTDTLIDTVFNTINLLIDAGSETKSLVSNTLTDITNETETVGSRVINLAEDGFSGTGSILDDIVHKIQVTLSGALNHVNLILHSPVSGIEDSLSAMISWIVNTVFELVSGTFNTARNGERDVQDAITNTVDEIGSMGGSLISETGGEIENLTSGLYKTISFVLSNLTNEIEESTGKAAKGLFKSINKTVMQTIPDDIFNTIYDAANDTTEAVIKDCQWFDLGVTNNCIFYYAYDAIKIPIELVIDSISEIISLVTDAALLPVTLPLDLIEAPVNIPIDIAKLAVSIPADIVEYVTEGVTDIGGPIVNLAGDVTNYLGGKLSSGAKEAESVVSDVGGRIFKALKKGFKMYL